MKSLKMKSILAAAILSTAMVIGTSTPVLGQKSAPPVLTVEKTSINKDLTHLTVTKDRVNSLQAQLRSERKAGTNTNVTKKELAKAKADRSQAQAYLQADKRDLILDHQTYIKEKRAAVREDRMALAKADLSIYKTVSDRQTAHNKDRAELKDDRLALKEAKRTRNNDLIAENKMIEKAKGQNMAMLKTEDAGAKLQNLAMK